MPTTTRIFNFSAGPAVLPVPVLEQAQRDMLSLPGVGMSVMEISHRSKAFEDLLNGAIADAGGVMPPMSTWFEPKLRDGLLSHLI